MQTRGAASIIFPDLASLQTIVNEELLFSKTPCAILRAYGSAHGSPDSVFVSRVAQFKARGIPTGAYYFATPTTDIAVDAGAEVNAQCDQFIAILQQAYGTEKYGDLIPFLDVEAWDYNVTPNKPMYYGLTGVMVLNWVKAFRDRFFEKTNRRLGLYAGRWFWTIATYPEGLGISESQLAELADMPLWLAEYDEYNANQKNSDYRVPDWGGWKAFSAWQYDVPVAADQWGVTHGTNQIDVNRTTSLDLLMPPPPPSDIFARMINDNTIEVTMTRPNVTDYIGSDIYINDKWKAWMAKTMERAVIDVTAYPDDADITIQLVSQDATLDFGYSEPLVLHIYPTLAEAQNQAQNLYQGGNFMPIVAMGTTIKKTGGTAIAGLTSIDGLDLSSDTIDTTTLDTEGGYRTFVSSFRDAGEVSVSGYFDYTAHNGILEDFQTSSVDEYVITFPNGASWTFDAVVVGFSTGADLEDLISFEATLKVSGKPTLAGATA